MAEATSHPVEPDKPPVARCSRLSAFIRLTGALLMMLGVIYLGIVTGTLWFGDLKYGASTEGLFVLVVYLLELGLGFFAIRVGLGMLVSINPSTIGNFSFVFALIYTPILMRLFPIADGLGRHPAMTILLALIYFGLTYLMLKRILLFLLFPKGGNDNWGAK
jgi:hypothetical protein